MQTAVLILLWTMVLWRAPAALRPGGPAKQRPLWFTFAALTVAMTLRLPDVMTTLDGHTGVNNLSTLLKHLLGVLAAASLLEFVFGMTRPDNRSGQRLRLAVTGTVMAVLVALFAVMPRETEVADFYETSAGSVTATGYLLVFFGFLGSAMAAAAWLFWGSSRHAGAGWLRTGLRILGAGTAAGVAYAVVRATYLVLRLTTRADDPARDATVSDTTDVLKHVAIALIVIGSSVPAVGVAWQSARYWAHLRRLRPLWHDLTAAVPEVVLDERLRRRELRLRLHRTVVEIRDALLALQPHVTTAHRDAAEEAATAAGPTGTDRRAVAEAGWVELARAAKLAGHPPATTVQRRDPGGPDEDGDGSSSGVRRPGDAPHDLEAEARWLRRVEAARHTPQVRDFTAAHLPSTRSPETPTPGRGTSEAPASEAPAPEAPAPEAPASEAPAPDAPVSGDRSSRQETASS
ncbi:hypothetical protein QNO07_04015 [Streptomyces sp. 549]|uniref:MAB_1171c family putative transporter n=1 Tax=Streptomyces sp. 549 TaxID=3049076 RepID=UPI0024C3DA87|nr:MAB_1171c family putative transporter [Streptomyces sp. 549]MDK1472600.1 hypothetical protein [Streptomyces sp. 549]